MFLKLTSYVQNPDYEESKKGLILNNQWRETPCMINGEEIIFVFPAEKTSHGKSMVKFRNGTTLTMKETFKEISDLLTQ